jgi:beta-glucosidase
MKRTNLTWVVAIMLYLLPNTATPLRAQKIPQLGKSGIKEVIGAMTIDEKARMLVGTGWLIDIPESTLKKIGGVNPFAPKPGSDTSYRSMINKVQKLVPGAAGTTAELSRFGIPPNVTANGPSGISISPTRKGNAGSFYCTAFPEGTLLASTWNRELVFKVGEAFGKEELEYGVDIALGPGMNIQRNPLCGRNFEYFSEDPFVTGKIGASMVNGIQSRGVGTSIKHFAANNQETNRNSVNVVVSERALREIYLEGFRIAVEESQPWTVMSSYNKINGTYTSESAGLLTDVLRKDWGFKGYVMTDWYAGNDIVGQVMAGNDLIMPGSPEQCKKIVEAVNSGKLDVKILDRNIEKILNIVLLSPRFKSYNYSDKPDLKASEQVARLAADEGMVLLKNEKSALPLPPETKKIAAFGNGSYEVIIGGTGSGHVIEAYSVSPAEGYQNAGYTVDELLKNTYQDYFKQVKAKRPAGGNFLAEIFGSKEFAPEMDVTSDLVADMAKTNDVAIITICRNAGEGQDRKVENDFNFSQTEKSLIKTVTAAFHALDKKVVVLLNVGGVVETASWRDMPDAILLVWQPGQEAGNAIADIIGGKVNPSGKLAVTFPINYEDVPSAKNFPGTSAPPKVVYEEGIFVGYRYYNSFGVKTAYEFGYGLSYTHFDYSNLKLSNTSFKDKIEVTVDVKNIGRIAGKEVVQLYLSAPSNKMFKPESELKGFEKTRMLQPDESQTLTFIVDKRKLASFDTSTSAWIAEAGKYVIKIGASSINSKLSGSFNLAKEFIVKQDSKALAPPEPVNELKPAR